MESICEDSDIVAANIKVCFFFLANCVIFIQFK